MVFIWSERSLVDHDRGLLSRTSSLCPVCLERVEASIIAEEAEVFLEKSCKDHGSWKTAIWRGLPRYEDWVRPKAPLYPETVYGEVRRQDVWNLDIERLRDCCISIMSGDGRLIPFCACNLTSATGESLYRRRKENRT
jgi:uncharacterized radical SAM superfamily Fe-S cluster-containing enzyme